MTDKRNDDDAMELAALARGLATVDLERSHADRIAQRAREDVGRGPPKRRWIEAILVGALAVATLGWAVLKLVEILR